MSVMKKHFKAKSILFKTPSEHTINKKNSDLEMQIVMDDLTESGKFGIFSLLFRATRTKKRNLLIEPFAAAAVNLVST